MPQANRQARSGTLNATTTSTPKHRGGIPRDAAASRTAGRPDSARNAAPSTPSGPLDHHAPVRVLSSSARRPRRGLTEVIPSNVLQERIWTRALAMLTRFRVMRSIDVAVHCFAERSFKAALTAAQRAVRGMVKAQLIRRYKTDRFQTVYGLTARGASWLDERGVDAVASVRRVSDMTNPEHRLWAQFLVLCCEARGLDAMTESELLVLLSRAKPSEGQPPQGLLGHDSTPTTTTYPQSLRPDLISTDSSGCSWFEVDRSKRSSEREESLRRLVGSIGTQLVTGARLCRLVVFAKTPRIELRALAVLRNLAEAHKDQVLVEGRRQVRSTRVPGVFEVWAGVLESQDARRQAIVDRLVGHVCIQRLPTWLPKVRIDARNQHSLAGWLDENYLPFWRPEGWPKIRSPLTAQERPTSDAPALTPSARASSTPDTLPSRRA